MASVAVEEITTMADKIVLKHAPHLGASTRSSSGRVLSSKPQVSSAVWKSGEEGGSLRNVFTDVYKKEIGPWDLEGEPQPVVIGAEILGFFAGKILDIGCGTGDAAIYLAKKEHEVVGIDISPESIEDAEARRAAENLDSLAKNPSFLVGDFFKLADAIPNGNVFDTTFDGGLFHCLNDTEQEAFVHTVAKHTRVGGRFLMFVFSDQNVTDEWHGPRRHSLAHLRASFNAPNGWSVDFIQPVTLPSNAAYVQRTGWKHNHGYFLVATRVTRAV